MAHYVSDRGDEEYSFANNGCEERPESKVAVQYPRTLLLSPLSFAL